MIRKKSTNLPYRRLLSRTSTIIPRRCFLPTADIAIACGKKICVAPGTGYYGMISYIDDKIGSLLEALDQTGLRDNTLIIFISDHGEMLGERGLWFKQHFWDWSARVPMIFNMPGTVAARRCDKVVSLVDLLPTLLDIADASYDQKNLSQFKLDGRSLAGTFSGKDENCPDQAICDYLAIGPCVPCRMVRKGRYKLYYTHGHPNMLFDMVDDPNELNNIAGQAAYRETESELQSICFENWNPDGLTERIVESQTQRKLIASATGHDQPWNYLVRTDDGTSLCSRRWRRRYQGTIAIAFRGNGTAGLAGTGIRDNTGSHLRTEKAGRCHSGLLPYRVSSSPQIARELNAIPVCRPANSE